MIYNNSIHHPMPKILLKVTKFGAKFLINFLKLLRGVVGSHKDVKGEASKEEQS